MADISIVTINVINVNTRPHLSSPGISMSATQNNECQLITILPIFNCPCPVVDKENSDFEHLISLAAAANGDEMKPLKIPDWIETSEQFIEWLRGIEDI